MTNNEILTQVLRKAINNGFQFHCEVLSVDIDCKSVVFFRRKTWTIHDVLDVHRVIFSHDFAKAFWGDFEIQRLDLKHPDPKKDKGKLISVDMDKLDSSCEAWVYVNIDQNYLLQATVSGFKMEKGILTWLNRKHKNIGNI